MPFGRRHHHTHHHHETAPRRSIFSRRRHHQTHHHHETAPRRSIFSRRRRQPQHHHKRKVSLADKISGALMKLRGSITHKPGVKAAGTRRMHGTDGRGSHRAY